MPALYHPQIPLSLSKGLYNVAAVKQRTGAVDAGIPFHAYAPKNGSTTSETSCEQLLGTNSSHQLSNQPGWSEETWV